ncbi:hypothetical protein JOQ06_028408, partial [Pogonophryne albipinna]
MIPSLNSMTSFYKSKVRGQRTRRGVGNKKKRGSLDKLQIAGNYLGSKEFCGASDASSRAEGSGRFLPRERGEMAVYPKRKRLTRLSRRRKKGGGENKGKKEGSSSSEDSPGAWSRFHTIPRTSLGFTEWIGSPPDPPPPHTASHLASSPQRSEGEEREERKRSVDENDAGKNWEEG